MEELKVDPKTIEVKVQISQELVEAAAKEPEMERHVILTLGQTAYNAATLQLTRKDK